MRAHALEVQLLCLKGGHIPESILASLTQLYAVTKQSSLQDYTVESLVRALKAVNHGQEARGLAKDYVDNCRRDLSPLSVPLAEEIRLLSCE